MNGHPNELMLERFSVDDMPAAERDRIAAHVAECAACRARLDEMEGLRAARMEAVPPEQFVDRVADRRDRDADLGHRRRFRRQVVVSALTAAAAAAAVLLLMPRPHGPSVVDEVRLKGGGYSMLRKRGAEVRVLAAADTVRSGDALQVIVTQSRPARVGVWFLDARGRVDALIAEGPVEVGAGRHALPRSVTVEAPCTDLLAVAASGDEIPATERAVQAAGAAGGGGLPAGTDWLPPGAWAWRLRCE